MHARVRHGQVGLVDHGVAVEEQVEIDRPRAEARALPRAAERALDLEEALEQLVRRELRLERRDAVEERGLVDVADGVGLAEPRDGTELDAGLGGKEVERAS